VLLVGVTLIELEFVDFVNVTVDGFTESNEAETAETKSTARIDAKTMDNIFEFMLFVVTPEL